MEQPAKQQVTFSFGAAAAFSLAAIVEAIVALTRGPGWLFLAALGFGGAAVLWWVVALTRNKRVA